MSSKLFIGVYHHILSIFIHHPLATVGQRLSPVSVAWGSLLLHWTLFTSNASHLLLLWQLLILIIDWPDLVMLGVVCGRELDCTHCIHMNGTVFEPCHWYSVVAIVRGSVFERQLTDATPLAVDFVVLYVISVCLLHSNSWPLVNILMPIQISALLVIP